MLQQAAGAQAGTDGPWGDVPGGKNKRSFREMVGRQGWILTLLDLANNPEFLPTPITDADRNEMRRMQTFAGPRGQRAEATRDGIDPNQGIRSATMGGSGTIDSMLQGMDKLKQEAATTGTQVKSSLEVQATPQINLGPLQDAVNLAQRFLSLIDQANAAASTASSNTDRQLRRGMADYGVSP